MRDVRRYGVGRGLRGGPGKRVDGVIPGRPQSFRHQHRPVDDYSPGAGWRNKRRNVSWQIDRCRKSQG